MGTPPNTFPRALIGWMFYFREKNTQLNKSMIKLLNFTAEDNCCQQSHQLKPTLIKKKKEKRKPKNKSQEKPANPHRPIQFLLKCLSMMGTPPNTFPTSLIGWIVYLGDKYIQLNKCMVKLLNFAAEGKLLSTITKQITSTENLNTTQKIHKIRLQLLIDLTNTYSNVSILFVLQRINGGIPPQHLRKKLDKNSSTSRWRCCCQQSQYQNIKSQEKIAYTCRPIPILGQVPPIFSL